MKKSFYLPFFLVAALLAQACSDDDSTPEPSLVDKEANAIENYADIVYASYDDSYNTAVILKTQIDAFVAAPSAEKLTACKNAWLAARLPYGQTEAYRFYNGPIDNENEANGPLGKEGLINAWPIDESFIDYTENGGEGKNLINNEEEYPTITKALLEELNESFGETSIFTGYHAIEFLLWGQDFNADGPGNRPYTDYLATEEGTHENAARRGQYLKVVTELLVDNLKEVRDAWNEGAAYRTRFVETTDTQVAVGYIFKALGKLSKGELAGERMTVAVDEHVQENEHSCFSDNTVNDIKMNFKGIKNVYFGSYTRVDNSKVEGASFKEIAEGEDAAKAKKLEEAFADAEAKINLIKAPFDQSIKEGSPDNDAIWSAIDALKALSDLSTDVAKSLKAVVVAE
jgi:putative iron-regulated protein